MKLYGYSNHNSEVAVMILRISELLILEYLVVWIWLAVTSKASHRIIEITKTSVEGKKKIHLS